MFNKINKYDDEFKPYIVVLANKNIGNIYNNNNNDDNQINQSNEPPQNLSSVPPQISMEIDENKHDNDVYIDDDEDTNADNNMDVDSPPISNGNSNEIIPTKSRKLIKKNSKNQTKK